MSAFGSRFVSACVIALSTCVVACQPQRRPPPRTATEQAAQPKGPHEQIKAWEDRRSLGDGALVSMALQAEDPEVRARALLALGRIQAASTAGAVARALADPEPLPRRQAAFAAGQLQTWALLPDAAREDLVQKLLAAEARETDLPVRLAQLEALGKLAAPVTIDRLVDRLLGTSPEITARAALSLGVAVRRGGQLPARAVTALAPHIRGEADPNARFGAVYALSVSKLPQSRPALLLCTQDVSSEVRLLCAKGLGDVGQDADAVTLRRLLDDPDYRVVVEATRALAKLADRCRSAACPALGALADLSFRVDRLEAGDAAGGGQPLLALAQQGLPLAGRPLLASLRGKVVALAAQAPPPLRNDLARLDCRLAAAMDRQRGQLAETLNCGGGYVAEPDRLALGLKETAQTPPADPARRVEEVGLYLRHADPKVKLAALDALGETKSASAAERVRPLIAAEDLVLAVAAAQAAGKLGDKEAVPAIRALATRVEKAPQLGEPVAEALAALEARDAEVELRAWLNHPHRHLRLSAAKALTRLTGQPVSAPEVERPPEPFAPPYLPKNARLLIRTEKGDIEVQLHEDAPFTAGTIYGLAQRGFYRNSSFHRVVPDFVAQGGDPRGDGQGGPGFTLRCETSPRPYARGVVGMALSGPDTGGSQFFITHSPQPHLDGRYTAFGEVVSGREVVDRLLEGDRILEVSAR
jgi:cyclophilin family peptidyl-prolyl cis-trans isomerase/HEAT repeat protein